MRHLIPFIILILISSTIYAQKTLNAVLLEKNSVDSLLVEMIVNTNYFDSTQLDETCINKTLKVVNEKEKNFLKEDWFKAKEIDYLEFVDFQNKKRIFVSPNYAPELKLLDSINIILYEKMFTGKISWYRRYYAHGYDRSSMEQDIFYKEGSKKPVRIHLFTTHKKQLLKITKDRPDLKPNINGLETDDDIYEILEMYNNQITETN